VEISEFIITVYLGIAMTILVVDFSEEVFVYNRFYWVNIHPTNYYAESNIYTTSQKK
jgi:hypothetical protein